MEKKKKEEVEYVAGNNGAYEVWDTSSTSKPVICTEKTHYWGYYPLDGDPCQCGKKTFEWGGISNA